MKRYFETTLKLTFFICLFVLLSANLSLAADSSEVSITCAKFQYPWCGEETETPAGLVARFYQVALGLVGGAALGVILYGAILWTLSEAVTKKQEALEWIKGAVWGLVLLLGAYLILYTINPDLVNLINPALEPISLKKSTEPSGDPSAVPGLTTGEIQPSYLLPTTDLVNAKLTQATVDSLVEKYGQGLQFAPGINRDGARRATVDEMLYVADLIGGKNMIVTSVTGGQHATGDFSHNNGYKFDAQGTDGIMGALDKFIMLNTSYFEDTGKLRTDVDGKKLPIFRNKETGAEWVLEPQLTYTDAGGKTVTRSRHWDVLVNPQTPAQLKAVEELSAKYSINN